MPQLTGGGQIAPWSDFLLPPLHGFWGPKASCLERKVLFSKIYLIYKIMGMCVSVCGYMIHRCRCSQRPEDVACPAAGVPGSWE